MCPLFVVFRLVIPEAESGSGQKAGPPSISISRLTLLGLFSPTAVLPPSFLPISQHTLPAWLESKKAVHQQPPACYAWLSENQVNLHFWQTSLLRAPRASSYIDQDWVQKLLRQVDPPDCYLTYTREDYWWITLPHHRHTQQGCHSSQTWKR